MDPRNHRRLMYTTFEDFRPGNPTAGLYVSTDGAASWRHVTLPVTPDKIKSRGTVGFAVGKTGQDHPWVLTTDGLLIGDTKRPAIDLPRNWRLVRGPASSPGAPLVDLTHLVSVGSTIIGCRDNTVYTAEVDALLAVPARPQTRGPPRPACRRTSTRPR